MKQVTFKTTSGQIFSTVEVLQSCECVLQRLKVETLKNTKNNYVEIQELVEMWAQ